MLEKEYRKLPIDSYSSFKDFISDRKKYYRKYILGEKISEEDDLVMRMGNVVEALAIPTEIAFEDKFYLSQSPKIPTGAMLSFTENLYKRTRESTLEDGSLDADMLVLLQKAYNDTKYDQNGNVVAFKQDKASSFEAIVVKFNAECKTYFDEILKCRPTGITVISQQDIDNGEKIKDELMTNSTTSQIMRMQTNDRYTVDNQCPVIFKIQDYDVKGLLDKRIIDHHEKKIYIYDLKITWNVDEFVDKYYLYRRSDIQAAIYYLGTLDFRDKNFPEYAVEHMQFIVADSINYNAPLIYIVKEEDVMDALSGFEDRGRKYKGLHGVIVDLKWHKETNIWNISRENFMNKGICKIRR